MDVWALGCVAAELVFGRGPFEVEGRDPEEIERRVLDEAPVVLPPVTRAGLNVSRPATDFISVRLHFLGCGLVSGGERLCQRVPVQLRERSLQRDLRVTGRPFAARHLCCAHALFSLLRTLRIVSAKK